MDFLLKKYKAIYKSDVSILNSILTVLLMILSALCALKSIVLSVIIFILMIIIQIIRIIQSINDISVIQNNKTGKITERDLKQFKKILKYDNFEEFKSEIDKEIHAKNVVKFKDTYFSPFYFYFTDNWFILLYRSNPLIVKKDKIISCSKEFVPSKGNEVIKLNIVGIKDYEICDCPDDEITLKIVKLVNEYVVNQKQWQKIRGNYETDNTKC